MTCGQHSQIRKCSNNFWIRRMKNWLKNISKQASLRKEGQGSAGEVEAVGNRSGWERCWEECKGKVACVATIKRSAPCGAKGCSTKEIKLLRKATVSFCTAYWARFLHLRKTKRYQQEKSCNGAEDQVLVSPLYYVWREQMDDKLHHGVFKVKYMVTMAGTSPHVQKPEGLGNVLCSDSQF